MTENAKSKPLNLVSTSAQRVEHSPRSTEYTDNDIDIVQ